MDRWDDWKKRLKKCENVFILNRYKIDVSCEKFLFVGKNALFVLKTFNCKISILVLSFEMWKSRTRGQPRYNK